MCNCIQINSGQVEQIIAEIKEEEAYLLKSSLFANQHTTSENYWNQA